MGDGIKPFKAEQALTEFSVKLYQFRDKELTKAQIPVELQPIADEIQDIVNNRVLTPREKKTCLDNIKAEVKNTTGDITGDIFKGIVSKAQEKQKAPSQADQEIQARIRQETVEEGAYVKQLSAMSEAGLRAHVQGQSTQGSPSGIEYLFSRELQVSNATKGRDARIDIGKRLAVEFSALTPGQVESLKSNEALWNLIEQYPEVAAANLSPQNLGILASNHSKQLTMKRVVDKLPADDHLHAKLEVLAPHTLDALDLAMGVKIESLTTFDWQYQGKPATPDQKSTAVQTLKATVKAAREKRAKDAQEVAKKVLERKSEPSSQPTTAPITQKRWSVGGPPKAAPLAETQKAVEKKTWSEQELRAFIQSPLGAREYEKSWEQLATMDDTSLRELTKLLDTKGLASLWTLEARVLNAATMIDQRKERLAIIFQSLSPKQMDESLESAQFQSIISNTGDGYANIAARHLSAQLIGQITVLQERKNKFVSKDLAQALKFMTLKMTPEDPEINEKLNTLAQVQCRSVPINRELQSNVQKQRMDHQLWEKRRSR